jgi:hypothetical protein
MMYAYFHAVCGAVAAIVPTQYTTVHTQGVEHLVEGLRFSRPSRARSTSTFRLLGLDTVVLLRAKFHSILCSHSLAIRILSTTSHNDCLFHSYIGHKCPYPHHS